MQHILAALPLCLSDADLVPIAQSAMDLFALKLDHLCGAVRETQDETPCNATLTGLLKALCDSPHCQSKYRSGRHPIRFV